MGDLTKNFSISEFSCPCGCGLDRIDADLIVTLQQSRDAVGLPYPINSGCRCEKHNRDVGGVPGSAHTKKADGFCKAADIGCENSHDMYLKGRDLILRFGRIEFGRKVVNGQIRLWIHVDIDKTLPQEVLILT